MWVKKCVKICVMLFKNWKLLFKNMYQTPPRFLWKGYILKVLEWLSRRLVTTLKSGLVVKSHCDPSHLRVQVMTNSVNFRWSHAINKLGGLSGAECQRQWPHFRVFLENFLWEIEKVIRRCLTAFFNFL